MIYSCPKDFKNGKYFFNKYGILDLLILVPGVIIGTLISIASISMMSDESFDYCMVLFIVGLIIDCLNFVLFMPMPMFHNLFQRLVVEIDYHLRQKTILGVVSTTIITKKRMMWRINDDENGKRKNK